MSKIGNTAKHGNFPEFIGTGTGSTQTYSLSWTPGSPQSVLVWVGGMRQQHSNYAVLGNSLIINAPLGVQIMALGIGQKALVNSVADGAIGTNQLANGGVTNAKLTDGVITAAKLKKFTSTNQTMTAGGVVTIAHGLGAAPVFITFKVVCLTAEAGYSIGDVVVVNPMYNRADSTPVGFAPRIDSTNITIAFNGTSSLAMIPKTGGAIVSTTYANWALIVEALA